MILYFDIEINILHLQSSIVYHSIIRYTHLSLNSEKFY